MFDGTFAYSFNVVLVVRLNFFILNGLELLRQLNILPDGLDSAGLSRPEKEMRSLDYSYCLQPCVFMFGAAEEDPLERAPHQSSQPMTTILSTAGAY